MPILLVATSASCLRALTTSKRLCASHLHLGVTIDGLLKVVIVEGLLPHLFEQRLAREVQQAALVQKSTRLVEDDVVGLVQSDELATQEKLAVAADLMRGGFVHALSGGVWNAQGLGEVQGGLLVVIECLMDLPEVVVIGDELVCCLLCVEDLLLDLLALDLLLAHHRLLHEPADVEQRADGTSDSTSALSCLLAISLLVCPLVLALLGLLLFLELQLAILPLRGIGTLDIDEFFVKISHIMLIALGREAQSGELRVDAGEFLRMALDFGDGLPEPAEAHYWSLDLNTEVSKVCADLSESMIPPVLSVSWKLPDGLVEALQHLLDEWGLHLGCQ